MRRRTITKEPEIPRETPCKICGVGVKLDDAVIEPDVLVSTVPNPSTAVRIHGQIRVDRVNWSRRHRSCGESWGWIVGRVLGVQMSDTEALQVVEQAEVEPVAFRAGRTAKKKPFDYLTAAQLEKLRSAWRWVDARSNGAPCDSGACGLCGVRVAVGWTESPLRWSDGSAAPLCGPCARFSESHGDPSNLDELRYLAQARMTSVPVYEGHSHLGMKLFVDLAGNDHRGHDRPWAYSPAGLREIQRRVWGQYPRFAPPHVAAVNEKIRAIRATRDRDERREAEEAAKVGSDISWTE